MTIDPTFVHGDVIVFDRIGLGACFEAFKVMIVNAFQFYYLVNDAGKLLINLGL